jgi:hypothetical protein
MKTKYHTLRGALPCLALALCAAHLPPAQAADSHPDLTGIWTWDTEVNKGAGRLNMVWPAEPPLKKEGQDKIAAFKALVAPTGESTSGFCLGSGMPSSTLQSGGYPMEIIQRPEQLTVIHEAHTEVRRIYIDQPRIAESDLFPTRNGYSTGHWEGDTLVVETSDLQESVDQTAAHSDVAHVVERFHLAPDAKGRKILADELTMTDPRFYTEPVTVTKTWLAAKQGSRMLDYDCNEPLWEDHLEQLAKRAAGKKSHGAPKAAPQK